MIKKELDQLPNEEKLIIIYWRIIEWPKVLSIEEISNRLKLPIELIQVTIKKFNHNVRVKLEIAALDRDIKKQMETSYWDRLLS